MRVFIGNFKGPAGGKGDRGDKGDKGDKGDAGQRGSRYLSGTAITGTSTTGVAFPDSGIDAQLYDYYLNTSTGNLYECTTPGTASVAKWTYAGSFKGPKGDTGPAGPAGSISAINDQKPTYAEAAKLENINSGETVKIAFGKIKKAISVLIAHYAQKATASLLGHVKLSSSTAITNAGEFALDAIEKNASIEGTLAHRIAQANSNLIITEVQFTYRDKFVGYTDGANSTVVKKYGSIATFNLIFIVNETINGWVVLGSTYPLIKAISYDYVFPVSDTSGNYEGIIAVNTRGELTIKPYGSWAVGKVLHATCTCMITI